MRTLSPGFCLTGPRERIAFVSRNVMKVVTQTNRTIERHVGCSPVLGEHVDVREGRLELRRDDAHDDRDVVGHSIEHHDLAVVRDVFLDLVGLGIIIPIQPFFAESFGATATLVTLLGASYSLMQFLFSPFWGRLSDRMGRRPIILFSVAISAL